jgi:hypothetical protein
MLLLLVLLLRISLAILVPVVGRRSATARRRRCGAAAAAAAGQVAAECALHARAAEDLDAAVRGADLLGGRGVTYGRVLEGGKGAKRGGKRGQPQRLGLLRFGLCLMVVPRRPPVGSCHAASTLLSSSGMQPLTANRRCTGSYAQESAVDGTPETACHASATLATAASRNLLCGSCWGPSGHENLICVFCFNSASILLHGSPFYTC